MPEEKFEKLETLTTQVDIPALVFIVDGYENIVGDTFARTRNRRLCEQQDKIEWGLETVARNGRAAHVHLILTCQNLSTSIFSLALKANLSQRFICSYIEEQFSRMIIDSEEGAKTPPKLGYYLGWCKGKTQQFQGYFIPKTSLTEQKDFIEMKFGDETLEETIEEKENKREEYLHRFKDFSSLLDWYQVPVGDLGDGTPYVWQMNYSPHCIICGQTGSGKTTLVNTMISHFISKDNVKLFLADTIGAGFSSLDSFSSVASFSTNMNEVVKTVEYLQEQIKARNEIMRLENLRELPMDGKLNLANSVLVNGQVFANDTIVRYRENNSVRICEDKIKNLIENNNIDVVTLPTTTSEEDDEETISFF